MEIALEYKNFGFSYPGEGGGVFQGVNWAVRDGEFALLVGPTGSGKTTLLRSAVPALRPKGQFNGDVLLNGASIADLNGSIAPRAVGYVAQNPDNQIVCDTVWHQLAFGLENLGVAQDEMRRRIAEVSHFLGIAPWFRSKTDELSGGQRQLLNLASVLVMQPETLLLDEPVSMLDPVSQHAFLQMLLRLNRELGLTVVVATHSPEVFAPYATSRLCLEGSEDGGKIPVKDCVNKKSYAIELRDIYMRYSRNSEFVIRGMNLQVNSGFIHAVIGGNGCGKSTLLKVIAGVEKTERGKLRNDLQQRQALLPQDPKALFACDTVMEELREWQRACKYSDSAILEAVGRYGLSGKENLHPYDLSGGQQQLLALAKLELTDPDLLLLDEPTKGLDTGSRLMLAQMLFNLQSEGRTILLATHDLSFAAHVADDVTLLFDGQAACTQPAAEFFAGSSFYKPLKDRFSEVFENGGGK